MPVGNSKPLHGAPEAHVLFYKIVGVAVLAFAYCSGYHCYSYYLCDYKLGVHVYCLWPLQHLLFVCTTLVLFVCTTLVLFMCPTIV